jgi:RHS repeat-associated protein
VSTEAFGYDSADRVTGACYGGALSTCASGSKITYAYDKVGNRSSQTKFGTTTTYTYDASDELTGSTVGSTTTLYSFDTDGQQTGEGYKTYSYNLAGELIQATDHSTTVATFSYDGDGNRLTKTASSVTTNYGWDENNDLPMLALEWQGSTTLRDYLYGDKLISMNSSGAAYYFHHDALDTTAALTKSTAAVEWTYTYDPYGNPRTTTKVDPSAPTNPIQYAGELLDSETALYDLRARTYNPQNGGFLTTDPLTPDTDQTPWSLYLYANAEPLLLTDPTGQYAEVDPCTGFGLALSGSGNECGGTAARAIHVLEAVQYLDSIGQHKEADHVFCGGSCDGGGGLRQVAQGSVGVVKKDARRAAQATREVVDIVQCSFPRWAPDPSCRGVSEATRAVDEVGKLLKDGLTSDLARRYGGACAKGAATGGLAGGADGAAAGCVIGILLKAVESKGGAYRKLAIAADTAVTVADLRRAVYERIGVPTVREILRDYQRYAAAAHKH